MYFKKLVHPEFFQGNHKKNYYFEGWYYKFVSHDELTTVALIPGVSINKDDSHAFIQVFLSKNMGNDVSLKTVYFRFDINDFKYDHKQFSVSIGQNTFTKKRISLHLSNGEISIEGSLKIENLTPIKASVLVPNIMGFFGYFNFMECYHGIVSMSHNLVGSLKINHNLILFEGGKGYIEKDWGKSFPRSYVWLQSNHFRESSTSFMFSYADIPFLGLYFKGLIANLIYRDKEYRFATYNGAKIKRELIGKGTVEYTVKRGRYLLKIKAQSDHQINLASPRNGKMVEQIKEGLSGKIHIALYKGKNLIFEDEGSHAGIEIMM